MKLMFDDELQDICVSDNIMKCVENDEIINIFKALRCDEKYTNGKASDFERFDEWERILPLVVGHREEKKYFEKIAAFGLLPVEASNYSRQRSIDRWRQANSYMHIGGVEERREVTKEIPVSLSLSHTVPRCFFNIENNVLKNINNCDNFKALFGKTHELAIAEKSEEICLNIKCFDSEYVRPDPYLAEQIFKKKISGEKYNHSEELVLYSQLLIELIIALKKEKRLSLFIDTDGDIKAACELICYLDRRHLFEGDTVISVTADTDLRQLLGLVSEVYPRIFVRPCIGRCEDEKHKNALASMFEVYPIGAFLFRNSCDLPYALTEVISG